MKRHLHFLTRRLPVTLLLLAQACSAPEPHPAMPAPVPPFQKGIPTAPSTSAMAMPQITLPDDLFSTQEPARVCLADMGIRTTGGGSIPPDITLIHKRIACQIPGEKMDISPEKNGERYSLQGAIRQAQKMHASHMLTSFVISGPDAAGIRTHVVTEITDVKNGLIIFRHQYDCPAETQPASMPGRSGAAGKYQDQDHND
jgi:hypothetical protein